MPKQPPLEDILKAKADKAALITAPDATDLASAITLLNDIKAKINAMNKVEA